MSKRLSRGPDSVVGATSCWYAPGLRLGFTTPKTEVLRGVVHAAGFRWSKQGFPATIFTATMLPLQ